MTIRAITPAQAGHAAAEGCGSALTDRVPHLGQKADPSNIRAKQRGQAIVASRARQYGHRGACGSAAAPQFGQCSESASFIPTSNAHRIDLSPPARRRLSVERAMGLMDFIKGELIEVIEWTDDSRDTLSYRFPDQDKAIKNGAQLIVRESQQVQFIYLGEFGDTFGPGKHTLTTDNIPILTRLKSWKYGFNSPFKADVYYVTTRLFTGNKWGTANPIMMRDDDLGIVRARAFGTFDFRITDPKLFLKEVAGSDQNFRLDEFADTMRSRIVSIFADALASAKIPVFDVASRYSELGEALLPLINPVVSAKYGLQIASFIVENVSVPPEVEQAVDKRSSMAAVGNLNDYVKFQMAQGMEKGGSSGGMATELAVGLSIAQQIMQQQGMPAAAAAAAPAPRGGTPAAAAELLSPADVAQALGVPEADVMTIIESGELAAKKIGTSYRIRRSALDEYISK
jgi:excisionase family DNA binding protein